jgi:hypothetical protein
LLLSCSRISDSITIDTQTKPNYFDFINADVVHDLSERSILTMKRHARSKVARKSAGSDARKQRRALRTSVTGKARKRRPAAQKIQRTVPPFDLGKIWEQIGKARRLAEFRVPFVRADDLLVCDFIFDNLQLARPTLGKNGAPKLVRKNAAAHATLIVEFPPQSFGEEAFLELVDTLGSLPSARIRMAGRSRVAFAMPATEKALEFSVAAILSACQRWPMRLDINAVPDQPGYCGPRSGILQIFDKGWLDTVIGSENWITARENLIHAAGGGDAVTQPLANAARRVALKAVEAIEAGQSRALANTLHRAMNQELDILAQHFAPAREAARRQSAFAALSLMTTQALVAHPSAETAIDQIGHIPFFPFIFGPHEPARDVTALELPYRLILSPVPEAYWRHATRPVIRLGRTELWHTRLVGGPDETQSATNLRALWSPDYPPGFETPEIDKLVNELKPFRMSLDPLDRQMLVRVTNGFDEEGTGRRAFHPCTARSRRLALSALGAQFDVEGSWYPPSPVELAEWRHIATFGRDHYVRVVYRGFLCHFGHAAALVKVTERKFESLPKTNNRVAALRQRFFIIVREQVKHYSGARHAADGRNFPFTSVEILTRVTPSLLAPENAATHVNDPGLYATIAARNCFWPIINGTSNDFLFQIAAVDRCGDRVTFAMPLLFVGADPNKKAATIDRIIAAYTAEIPVRRTAPLGNAAVCYAPQKDGAEGDTRLPTANILFTCGRLDGTLEDEPNFYPELESANVGIAAVQRLLQRPDFTVDVTYPNAYKNTPGGFGGGNAGEIFLKTLSPLPLDFGEKVKSDAIGGLATPTMAIQGLSRVMGPVAGQIGGDVEAALGNVINNKFNPADFFNGAKILGGVELAKILETANSLAGGQVPKLLSKRLPDKIEASFDWHTQIKNSDPLGLFVPNAGGPTNLDMNGVVSSPFKDPKATTFHATASIINFKVNLFGFITIWFDRLRFISETGKKPDVAVELHPGEDSVVFGGPLEFVNELRKIIPSNGFSDPPSLSVTPSGISAGYSVNIPSLSVGIFALEHLSLGAGFALPFDAKPAEVRFNFSERQRPFSLTVSLLGGGGFLLLGIGAEGVKEIEAALEFGAAISIDLGVASGSVEIKAGVYFHWLQPSPNAGSVELAGYVRLHGELCVLGLISASLTFDLKLAYLKEGGQSVVWGEATLEVEIEILFFSASVSVKCRREFGGSAGDPKFIELIPDQGTWDDYCEAFAEEAA